MIILKFLLKKWTISTTSKRIETAVDVLYDLILPFYQQHKLSVEAILTDNGTGYKGRPMVHMYEIFFKFNGIEHHTTKVGNPGANGFVERFYRILLEKFFRSCFRKKLCESVQTLQSELDEWLHQ